MLVGTALTVIIPEGVNSLYSQPLAKVEGAEVVGEKGHESEAQEKHEAYSSTIGLSLVLGFVFMMIVDQISSRRSKDLKRNSTATIGLVVHAAADGVALGK